MDVFEKFILILILVPVFLLLGLTYPILGEVVVDKQALKSLAPKLEELNLETIQIEDKYGDLIPELSKKVQNRKLLDKIISRNDLCSIIHYKGNGIAYNFKCENDTNSSMWSTDMEYYLVKLYSYPEDKEDFLGRENFVDYGGPPEELPDNWYLFTKRIYFD